MAKTQQNLTSLFTITVGPHLFVKIASPRPFFSHTNLSNLMREVILASLTAKLTKTSEANALGRLRNAERAH